MDKSTIPILSSKEDLKKYGYNTEKDILFSNDMDLYTGMAYAYLNRGALYAITPDYRIYETSEYQRIFVKR